MLLPVLYDWLSPGDRIKLNDRIFTRTQPLKSAAMVKVNQYIDYFFVPTKQIDPYFNSAFFGIGDVDNSNDFIVTSGSMAELGKYKLPGKIPCISFAELKANLSANFKANMSYTLENGVFSTYINRSQQSAFNIYGIPELWDVLRLFDMLGYGSKWFANVSTTPSQSYSCAADNRNVNLNLFFVYQKIFYDYYRRNDYEGNNPFAFNLGYYYKVGSFDYSAFQPLSNTYKDGPFVLRYHPLKRDYFNSIQPSPLFDPVYSPAGFLAYSASQSEASANLQSVSSNVLSAFGVNTTDFKENKLGVSVNPGASGADPVNGFNQIPTQITLVPSLVGNIRFAYAYEKMLMITQRASKHYDEQVMAHYGVKVPRGIHSEVYYLGGHTNRLAIGEVIATAAGADGESTSSLGEIAGRGVGSGRRDQSDIEFTAPCHGYLMAIQSTVPEISYKDYGLWRANAFLSINDYPHPEFDRIGMEPAYYWESYCAFLHPTSTMDASVILGWQYRNTAFKLAYDVVHGAFNDTLSDWVCAYVFGNMVTTYNPSATYNYSVREQLYCPPTALDNLFALSYLPPRDENGKYLLSSVSSPSTITAASGAWTVAVPWSNSVLYQRDPFLNCLDIVYHKVSYMSQSGMPSLN